MITNHTWKDFWLNEGYTMWLERKIVSRLHNNPKLIDFDAIIGWKSLQNCVDHFGHDNPLTACVPDLKGIDPDDAFR